MGLSRVAAEKAQKLRQRKLSRLTTARYENFYLRILSAHGPHKFTAAIWLKIPEVSFIFKNSA